MPQPLCYRCEYLCVYVSTWVYGLLDFE